MILWEQFLHDHEIKLKKCKPVIIAFCLFFALLLLLGSTNAWFTSQDALTNNLKNEAMKTFKVSVVDVFDNTPPQGDEIWNKRVGAVNLGEKPSFVRLLVTPVFVAQDGETALSAEFGSHVILEDLNTADWIDGGDGYYYYKHILSTNTSTDLMFLNKNLFNKVSILNPLPEIYKNANLKIEVKCEAVGIKEWDYRMGWWGSVNAPTNLGQKAVDDILEPLSH